MPISVFPPTNGTSGVASFNTRTGSVTLLNTDIDGALGFTPYSASNPSGYISGITSGDVTTALGFTPYSAANPSGYISGITSGDVTTALGFTPYSAANPSGYISGITSGMVTTALGFTPYDATNPAGYITSAALTGYLQTSAIGVTVQAYDADLTSWAAITPSSKQDTLVSATNIKTINGSSILGSGDLVVSGTVTGFWAATVDKLTGTQASSALALANVTQLVEPMVANGVYTVNCFVTFQSAATTTGLNLGFTSPTGTICQLEVVVPITSTAAASQLRTIFPNAAATNTGNVLGTGVTAINSNHTARISGIVTCGSTPGNFQIQFASEVNGSAITLQIGSSLVMQRIA